MYKELLSLIGILLTMAIFVPYIRSILHGRIRPHVFSWFIWAQVTCVVFLAQLLSGGGLGAWPIGLSGLMTGYVAVLAYRQGMDRGISRSDWVFLWAALSAIPCWFITSDPLWAVVILTGVDLAGFGPTFRSAYACPHQEHMGFYALIGLRNAIAVMALERYSLTTVLFPATTGLACLILVVMIWYQRRRVAPCA